MFYHNCLEHVCVLSCEITCTTFQRFNAFQYFIVTTMKIHGTTADLISYFIIYQGLGHF